MFVACVEMCEARQNLWWCGLAGIIIIIFSLLFCAQFREVMTLPDPRVTFYEISFIAIVP